MKYNYRKNKQIALYITYKLLFIVGLFILNACSTYRPQYGKDVKNSTEKIEIDEAIQHRFYLIGDAGNADQPEAKAVLNLFQQQLQSAPENSTLIFLGDNIYPHGMPVDTLTQEYALAKEKLDDQLNLTKDFKGNFFFIAGNHDWYNGIEGLTAQAEYIKNITKNKKSFLPRKNCGIEELEINENISLIVIDSQWFLEDWNNQPNINEHCDIKNRDDFFDEFDDLLNDLQSKTTFVVLHHPLISNGSHGGQFSVKKQIFPFESKIPMPVIGTLINQIRKTSGLSPQDVSNFTYQRLATRLETLLKDRTNVVFFSGHDHNIQYLEKKYIKQIISGSGSKTEDARAILANDFSYGGNGFVIVDTYKNGSTIANFYGIENDVEKLLFSKEILEPRNNNIEISAYNDDFPEFVTSQVYPDKLNQKSKFYKFWFGDHYRDYYTMPIKVPTINLSTYKGGLTPIKVGGGNQSRSLRVVDSEGKEYVLRALHKSATQFVQNLAFKNQFIEPDLKNTFTDRFILDFYTTTNPYYPFVINELNGPVGLYHTNPKLFYLPKQSKLGIYNENFGDELYMFEERPMKKFNDLESFGKPHNIVNTNKMIENVTSDEDYQVDYKTYIRARLFDMLIGDWDRHADQWRWAEFHEDDEFIYRPIARDRDQAFPKYDGAFISFIMRIPALKHMQNFGPEIKNLKWFNMEPYPLDLFVTNKATLEDWIREAEFINANLTDEIIDNSFQNIPDEVNDENVQHIKNLLKIRKAKLFDYATEYFQILQKTVIIPGTEKDDKFVVSRKLNGFTNIQIFRLKKDGEELYFENEYNPEFTKEIWLYGLNDKDQFIVEGKQKDPIKVRLIGGLGDDVYETSSGKNVFIYDFNNNPIDKKLTKQAKLRLSDNYNINTYNYHKPKYNRLQILPNGWYNPDDGVGVGLNLSYTINNFKRNPFTDRHQILTNYFFLTNSFSLDYKGIFANVYDNWNLELGVGMTNAAFSSNFFGLGNQTTNFAKNDHVKIDYYRVRSQTIYFSPELTYIFRNQGKFSFKTKLERVKVQRSNDRITYQHPDIDSAVYNNQYYGEVGLNYHYRNYDNLAQPNLGFIFELGAFWLTNLKHSNQQLPYLQGTIGFTQKITKSDVMTFSTRLKSKFLFSNHYEFYQAATLGGDEDLRAYPKERFSGKSSLLSSSDIRIKFGKFKGFVPMTYGGLIGYDIGRVWMPNENSKKWHQSIGGSLWISGANILSFKTGYFYGDDGGRITIGVNFGF